MPCHRVCMDPVPPGLPHCPCFPNPNYANPEAVRAEWEAWDLRVLTTCILYTELFLLFFGRRRRKTAPHLILNKNVWLLYLLVELLATISLGKLSNANDQNILLRGLWAPIILFYLGGPDTITVLRLEENDMWVKHLVAFFTKGFRTSYLLYATWGFSALSILAMLLLFSGLIKYGERVWIIRSRVLQTGNHEHFVRLDESALGHPIAPAYGSHNVLVIQAYSYFRTLKPHDKSSNFYGMSEHTKLIQNFQEWVRRKDCTAQDAFKLIEIELGFTYDALFSKVDTIFNMWGFIFRFISFSCIVTAFVWFLLIKNTHETIKGDIAVTMILLVGAICLEIGGVLVQISSDWAIVWACKHHAVKLVTPISHLHKLVNFKRKRWSELMGQFNLLDIYASEYKLTMSEEIVDCIYGKETSLNKKFSLPLCPVELPLKELIFNHLREIVQNVSEVKNLPASTLKRGKGSLEKNQCLEQFKWSIELEFSESITIWHIVTDICYHSREGKSDDDAMIEETKKLSSYMMHLLYISSRRLRICDTYDKFILARDDLKKFFQEEGSKSSKGEAKNALLKENYDPENRTIGNIQKLAKGLLEKENRWKIMSNVWVEMLFYAASNCSVKNHVQQLNNGGELLTHVWLLMLHLGVRKRVEEYPPPPNWSATVKSATRTGKSIMENFTEFVTCGTESAAS